MKTLLMVDDEIKLRKILARELEEEGYRVLQAGTGAEALRILEKEDVKVLLLDLMLPDMTGLDVLSRVSPRYEEMQTLIITAYGNVESAVTAMKLGAFDYLCKPVRFEELKLYLEKAFDWVEMKEENKKLKELVSLQDIDKEIIGKSRVMEQIYYMIQKVAATDVTVLLEGESGTGKSLLAKLLHENSTRKEKPLITVNCAAIPENLLESELFGYVKGSFTGAGESRPGKFAAADGGTIFLDEIGEVPLSLQAKLLQFTQDKTFMPLGSNTTKRVNVRIVAATNRNLLKMVEEGSFREDLYYRLNIVSIKVPSLRERKDDIPHLVAHFLAAQEEKIGKSFHIAGSVMEELVNYDWPGNIRELKNAIERVTILCRGETILLEDFLLNARKEGDTGQVAGNTGFPVRMDKALNEQVEEFEKHLIVRALNEANGNLAKGARLLQVSRQNLMYKLQKYNLHQ